MTESSSEDTSARLLPQGVGIAADVAAVSALVIAGGSPLVVAAGALAVFTGVYVVWKRWAKPVDRTLAVAAAVAALGAGVIGFSLKPSSPTPPADVAASTTSRTTTTTTSSPTTTSAPSSPPSTTTSTSTSTSVSTTPTSAPANRKLYSSGGDRESYSIDFEDGLTTGQDLMVGPTSLDSEHGSQFALLERGAPDPVYGVCAARPDGDWRTSVPLAEFREEVRVLCIRTNQDRLGFVEVKDVRMVGESFDSVYLRWAIWE
ncbi:hypothetical protein ACQPYE_05075 [Actinosynnema sp. CA-299493]